jgi:acetolactate synthase I/II/III large subunit
MSAHASKGWRLADAEKETVTGLQQRLKEVPAVPASAEVVHPTQIVTTLRELLPDETVVACDIGSNYVWMARHFHTFESHRLLFSNGQQTLGVALPWAIAASLIEPDRKAVSVSGDGGFGFSAMELETAVRLQSELVHLVWSDGTYDMVASQQRIKYGRASGTDLGTIDFVAFARSFGATGMRVTTTEELRAVLESALATPGPVIVEIPVDYSHNSDLFATVHDDVLD